MRGGGLQAWLLQRVSAVYLALFAVFVAFQAPAAPWSSHAAWSAWLARPEIGVPFGLCFLALAVHAWVGMRDVVMDYLRVSGPRLVVLVLLGVFLIGCLLWAWGVLLRVGP